MRRRSLLIAAFACLVVFPALAQAPPQGTPIRVRGTVDKLDGKTLTVKTKDGQTASVTLAEDVNVVATTSPDRRHEQ